MRAHVRVTALASLLGVIFATTEGKADCGPVATALTAVEGYVVTVLPAPDGEGWCVLDGARFRSQTPGWPDFAADRLRMRQSPTEIEVDLQGLRASPRASDREVDQRLRSVMRLQSADLSGLVVRDPAAGVLTVSGARLELSSGAVLELDADIRGADLSPASVAVAAVTRATLVWRNDGRLPGPVMDLVGEGLTGTGGAAAVEASRAALAGAVEALPTAAIDDASRKALAAAVRAMPQGRGKLTLTLVSEEGIGAGRLALAALSGDPVSPKALDALFAGATITAAWQAGLSQ
jgi:hypothetical protein